MRTHKKYILFTCYIWHEKESANGRYNFCKASLPANILNNYYHEAVNFKLSHRLPTKTSAALT